MPRLFLLVPLLAIAVWCCRHAAPSTAQPASTTTSPSLENEDPLRLTISVAPKVAQGRIAFLLELENTGENDIVLNLGSMLANGKVHRPDAIRLILTDANGAARELHFVDRKRAGVAGRMDDYVLPLRAGSAYRIKVRLSDYWCPETGAIRLNLPAGAYRIRAELTGSGAKHLNGDTQGMKLMHFWTGELRSDETGFALRAPGP